jgi:hypothetical protein
MTNVAHINGQRSRDWPYSDRQMRLLASATRQGVNPPAAPVSTAVRVVR